LLNNTYHVVGLSPNPNGLVPVTSRDIQVLPGAITAFSIQLPSAFLVSNVVAPNLTGATFEYAGSGTSLQAQVVLTGHDFTLVNSYTQGGSLGSVATDLIVTFVVGGADTVNPDGTINSVGDVTSSSTAGR